MKPGCYVLLDMLYSNNQVLKRRVVSVQLGPNVTRQLSYDPLSKGKRAPL